MGRSAPAPSQAGTAPATQRELQVQERADLLRKRQDLLGPRPHA